MAGPRHRDADRLLFRASWHGGRSLGLLALTALLIAGAETALPAVLGRAVDAVVAGASTSWLTWCGLLIAVLLATDMLDDVVVGTTTARATAWLRHGLIRQVLDLGNRAGRLAPGDAASRMVGNAGAAGRVAPDVVRAAANLIPSVGGIVALGLIDPLLCVTFLAGMPLLVVLLRTFVRDASSVASGYLETQAGIASRLVEALSGARTIAAAGTAEREVGRVLRTLPQLQRYGMDMWRAQIRVAAQDTLLLPLLEILVLAVAGFQLAAGRITPGELLAAGQYVQLASTIGSAAGTVTRLARARAGAARVAEVLSHTPPAFGEQPLPPGPGCIEFRRVSVRAGDRSVLDGLSFVVPGGALVALVGRSGSGKSLVAALAGRLVDPDEGAVLLDGVDLKGLSREELRREVTYGFERPALIGDTVADAIAFGGAAPSQEEIVAAAHAARADAFIRHLPAGYETLVPDAPMSGGEVQRMGLARTFAHARRVVVLDDVAASLDTVTEHQISEVLTGRLGDRTRLVVANRASTAARADLVVWLDGGRLRAVAPHRLLWADPRYRTMFGAGERPYEVALDARPVRDGPEVAGEETLDTSKGAA